MPAGVEGGSPFGAQNMGAIAGIDTRKFGGLSFPDYWRQRYGIENIKPNRNVEISARKNELPEHAPILGFTPERTVFIRGLVERIGLPLDRVASVTYKPNDQKTEHTLGQAAIQEGRLYFFKRMENLPAHAQEISQVAVAAHELWHINSAFFKGNEQAYGGAEKMQKARENVKRTADLCADNRSFLTPYHKQIYTQWKAGAISEQVYLLETEAIMGELRLSNPKKLEQVLVGQNVFEAVNIMKQLNDTTIKLMKLENVEQLNNHVEALRKFYQPKKGQKVQ
jgi:hypothetical protein